MMEFLKVLAVILGLSALVESIAEWIFGEIANHFAVLTPFKWLVKYIAMGIGVVLALHYQFDFVHLLSEAFEMKEVIPVSVFGVVPTGLLIGRGAVVVHDFIMKFFPPQK